MAGSGAGAAAAMVTYMTTIAALASSRWVGWAVHRARPITGPSDPPRARRATRRSAHATASAPNATAPATGPTAPAVAGRNMAAIATDITTWLASAAGARSCAPR